MSGGLRASGLSGRLTVVLIVTGLVGAFFAGSYVAQQHVAEASFDLVDGHLVKTDPTSVKTTIEPSIFAPPQPEKTETQPAGSGESGDGPGDAPDTDPTAHAADPDNHDAGVKSGSTESPPQEPKLGPISKPATFKIIENRDMTGGDLGRTPETSRDSCQAACASRPDDCRGFTYNKWAKLCFLKSDLHALSLNPRVETGVASDAKTPAMSTGPVSFEKYPGHAFPGQGYKTLHATSKSCLDHCAADTSCVAFTHGGKEDSCTLFDQTGEYFPHAGFDCGDKRQKAE